MTLGELIKGLAVVRMSGDPATEIASIEHDSRMVRPGAAGRSDHGNPTTRHKRHSSRAPADEGA